ncbi:MAG: sigma-70 family RNA polymerase sigma factor [Planctomycetes bacterium]|nr:sigma-70 family RNA polymerase sigma factor [Planctomycetota bacterium]
MSERESCFRELLGRNHARWRGIARCYAKDGDRDDLIQEIMMQIWKNLDRFESRSSIDTWAYRVALNTALAWDRTSKKRAKKLNTDATDVNRLVGDSRDSSIERRVLDEFLTSLSKTDRAVMLLFLDDVPNADAAEITGMTEGALRVRLHRIRNKFEATYCEGEVSDDV